MTGSIRGGRTIAVLVAAVAVAATAGACGGGDAGALTGDIQQTRGSRPTGGVAGAVGSVPGTSEAPAPAPPETEPTTTTAPPPPTTAAPAPKPAARSGGGGTPGCPNVEIVTARGTGESQSASFGLAGLNQGIASQVPGTTTYQVVYPASVDFLNSAGTGTQDALAHMRAKAGQCANTRFFLTGYSQGAMVMTGVLQKVGDLAPRIIGGVFYGNPYYKGSSPTAAGPDKAANGIIPGGIPASWGGKVRDYCVQGDSVCGSGANGTLGLGSISAAHLTYPRSALEREAIAWAVGVIR